MRTSDIDINKIRETAENYYRNGDFFCSEAIVKTIKDEFKLPISDEIVAAASGFPIGIGGSGCKNYYRNGDFFCSEAIVKTIKDEFKLPISDEIVAAASGFPIGIGGSGCICGAVSGGVMALGLVFGRQVAKDPKVRKTMELTKELHEKFRNNHKSLCCGAVSGGVMALGLVFGRQVAKDPKVRKTMELTKELHEKFRNNHKSLCCRILTKGLDMGSGEHKEQCISFTGEVAEEVAKIIVRELNLEK